VCAELHLAVLPSAPEDQATNPEERMYQTISHRMAALMLQQSKRSLVAIFDRSLGLQHSSVSQGRDADSVRINALDQALL
jgi:hypothetical protein